jgi:hypothetical protein
MVIDKEIITTIVAPITVALISWFIKDYIFAILQKRQEVLRTEWKIRLTECWSPIFFWSGMILAYSKSPEKLSEAVKELEKILAKNANLIPIKHYHVLVKSIELATNVVDEQLDMSEIKKTRVYIYSQIELLNFVLYKKDTTFDPSSHVSLFGSQQALLRLASQIILHVVSWGILAVYIYWIYTAVISVNLGLNLILLAPLLFIVIHDLNKKYKLSKEAKVS